ncbi:short-chain dehydrogenase [Bradyrhizobium brasilense]|uniref:short-chain dehydrogenase/reductase n=1 Tax=Bradyrhizobium brasilense TaxID=1419277 RepID=UPI00097837B0|nr:short-chain dehydrogenase/reductase [Bradyrhizobium brasilense]OMI06255.1 short-chain dehydrogenase [Bradyrhizobium brasilense]
MDLGLSKRKVLISGGSKGIGFAIASLLISEGCEVILAARSRAGLDEAQLKLRSEWDADVQTIAVDIADQAQRDSLVAAASGVDILINNAGAIPRGSLEATNDSLWRSQWDLKVFGYINLTRSYLSQMRERGKGVILNIIGIAGELVDSNYVAGSAGNAALIAFTRAVGGTSIYDGVRVLGINPGPVGTERLIRLQKGMALEKYGDESRWSEFSANLPYGRPATPNEIAHTAAFLISDLSSYTSGTVINIDGGLSGRRSYI